MKSVDHLDDRLDFFDLAQRGFDRAAAASSTTEMHCDLAGRLVRLRFAGSALSPRIGPALAHRQVGPSAAADLTIYLWDSVSTGGRLPLLLDAFLRDVKFDHWQWLDARHGIQGFHDGRILAVFRLGPADILSVFDTASSTAVYWTADGSLLPYWECGSPLQTILNWWAESRDLQYVHAAAVGTRSGAVLLAGPGGSGKSTASLACLDSDLEYVADDYCLLGLDPHPMVFSLYNTAKLMGAADLARFPHLVGRVVNPERNSTDKALLNLYPSLQSRLLDRAPVRAVVLPAVTGAPTSRLVPVGGAEALRALAPSTLFQLPGTRQSALSRMGRLVRSVPCYRLEMGLEVRGIPPLLSGLLT